MSRAVVHAPGASVHDAPMIRPPVTARVYLTRLPACQPPAEELDALIDAGEVAAILGLAHRNSVSTYRSRYPTSPPDDRPPVGVAVGCGPARRSSTWHAAFRARQSAASEQPSARLEDLVAATTRLLVTHPGQEISIRQIAAEAGVAHSDLYRYATSKDQLVDLAIARLEQSVATALPDDYDLLVDNLREAPGRVARGRRRHARPDRPGPAGQAREAEHSAAGQHHRRGHHRAIVRRRAWHRRSTRGCCRHASCRSAGDSTSSSPAGSSHSSSTRSRSTRWPRSSGPCSRPEAPRHRAAGLPAAGLPWEWAPTSPTPGPGRRTARPDPVRRRRR